MVQRRESFCRVGDHWCTECCEGMGCDNLGQFSDGSWGCLGHSLTQAREISTSDGTILITPQPPACKMTTCQDELPYGIQPADVIRAIQKLPAGEFYFSQVINTLIPLPLSAFPRNLRD